MAGWVLHVDMDQFIAAVEMLRRPELRGRPVVVGGDGDPTKRGVVATASYEARAHGVHSGVPLRVAVRRCPEAVFLPVDRDAYEAVSAVVMATLRDSGWPVESLGWDEAFVGVDSDDPGTAARDIQREVFGRTGLHCTVGIGRTKIDIVTVAQLAGADPERVAIHFGPTTGPWLVRLGQGHHDSAIESGPRVARSRSRELTFQHDLAGWDDVQREVAGMARGLMNDIAAEEREAIRVWVKIRYVPFSTRLHGRKLVASTKDPEVFAEAALAVLTLFPERRPVRLVGVRAEYA